MNIDRHGVECLIAELIDENALACRAFLSIARTEFTSSVPTASVSLGENPVLRINLDFVQRHCATESHVKALLIHEFLHVLLRHTLEIRRMSPAMNIALDAVINAMIHRKLGEACSSFMSTYYARGRGPTLLLRPPNQEEMWFPHGSRRTALEATDPDLLQQYDWLDIGGWSLWHALYRGNAVHDDVREFLKAKDVRSLEDMLSGVGSPLPVLLGNHDGSDLDPDDLPSDLLRRLRQSARELAAAGMLPGSGVTKPGQIAVPAAQDPQVAAWEAQTVALLRRMVTPDPSHRITEPIPVTSHLPVLHGGDRRGVLRSLWSPILSENEWPGWRAKPRGSVAVYLDVSGSMHAELERLVQLLHRFERYLRRPFYAFANTVEPARISEGRLITASTGGTSLQCVLEHVRKTQPQKALIITDGFVEKLKAGDAAVSGVSLHFLLSAKGTDSVIRPYGHPISRLATLPGVEIDTD